MFVFTRLTLPRYIYQLQTSQVCGSDTHYGSENKEKHLKRKKLISPSLFQTFLFILNARNDRKHQINLKVNLKLISTNFKKNNLCTFKFLISSKFSYQYIISYIQLLNS